MSKPEGSRDLSHIRLTKEQIDTWNALEEVSKQELEAMKNETPAEAEAAVQRIVRKVIGPRPRRPKPMGDSRRPL